MDIFSFGVLVRTSVKESLLTLDSVCQLLASYPAWGGQEAGQFPIPLPEVEFIVDGKILHNYWLLWWSLYNSGLQTFETEGTLCIVKR